MDNRGSSKSASLSCSIFTGCNLAILNAAAFSNKCAIDPLRWTDVANRNQVKDKQGRPPWDKQRNSTYG